MDKRSSDEQSATIRTVTKAEYLVTTRLLTVLIKLIILTYDIFA